MLFFRSMTKITKLSRNNRFRTAASPCAWSIDTRRQYIILVFVCIRHSSWTHFKYTLCFTAATCRSKHSEVTVKLYLQPADWTYRLRCHSNQHQRRHDNRSRAKPHLHLFSIQTTFDYAFNNTSFK